MLLFSALVTRNAQASQLKSAFSNPQIAVHSLTIVRFGIFVCFNFYYQFPFAAIHVSVNCKLSDWQKKSIPSRTLFQNKSWSILHFREKKPVSIYSCFERGCLTNGEKLTRQCRMLLWVMRVVFTVGWVNFKVFQHGGGKQKKHVCSIFLVPCWWITLNLNQAKPNSYYP